jgi:hypothetical protein
MSHASSGEEKPEWQWNDLEQLCSLGQLLESKIGHEVALIGHRMEWLVVSEAFLFGAFATVLASGSMDASARRTMVLLLPILGMTLAGLASIGVLAALAVSRALLKARGVIDNNVRRLTAMEEWSKLGYRSSRKKSIRWTEPGGKVTAILVPPLILLAWVWIFIGIVLRAEA